MFGWSIMARACRSASKRAMTCLRVHARLDDLQSDLAADRLCLLGHVDDAQAAFADLLEELVRADVSAGIFAGRTPVFGGLGVPIARRGGETPHGVLPSPCSSAASDCRTSSSNSGRWAQTSSGERPESRISSISCCTRHSSLIIHPCVQVGVVIWPRFGRVVGSTEAANGD